MLCFRLTTTLSIQAPLGDDVGSHFEITGLAGVQVRTRSLPVLADFAVLLGPECDIPVGTDCAGPTNPRIAPTTAECTVVLEQTLSGWALLAGEAFPLAD